MRTFIESSESIFETTDTAGVLKKLRAPKNTV